MVLVFNDQDHLVLDELIYRVCLARSRVHSKQSIRTVGQSVVAMVFLTKAQSFEQLWLCNTLPPKYSGSQTTAILLSSQMSYFRNSSVAQQGWLVPAP